MLYEPHTALFSKRLLRELLEIKKTILLPI